MMHRYLLISLIFFIQCKSDKQICHEASQLLNNKSLDDYTESRARSNIYYGNDSYSNITFFKNKTLHQTSLSLYEIIEIEKILIGCIREYNRVSEKKYWEDKRNYPGWGVKIENYIIDLKKYNRQYIASTNINSEKVVWINCFCHCKFNWRKGLVLFDDGGNCFFNVSININRKECSRIRVNSDA